ncbi:hypothetical protein FJTKL_06492 [Diaporthe vaccinii]|uniref:Uncharacterized protein n=1 Tax=Diaporthe vaccinii TaxID=105482 RepID=A0ABR4EX29_9PEZI
MNLDGAEAQPRHNDSRRKQPQEPLTLRTLRLGKQPPAVRHKMQLVNSTWAAPASPSRLVTPSEFSCF